MSNTDRSYVLGTHDAELSRLQLQHEVWKSAVMRCWTQAGITSGSRVGDIGAGPGYATVDLATLVGPAGRVVAVERSTRFVAAGQAICARQGLQNVNFYEADLMAEPLRAENLDFTWCRWVASFVSSVDTLVERISGALKPGGTAIFHEYVNYASWRFVPPKPNHDSFVAAVMRSWRAAGGEPDVASELVRSLRDRGFTITRATPLIHSVRPGEPMWQWPASFIGTNVDRLVELGRTTQEWADAVRSEFAEAEADPQSILMTPMVLEIIARRS